MDLEQLQTELVRQEQFSPDLDAVRERVRLATRPAPQRARHRVFLRRRLAIAASFAVVAVLAAAIALVHAHSPATRIASPPVSTAGGTHWELTSATVSGMPDYGSAPNETESLYLYTDGTSVATGFCFTRLGRWHQSGTDLVFTDQHTLDHPCDIGMNSTAPRLALLRLGGSMSFTTSPNVLHLRNDTTTITLKAAGSVATNPGPASASTDPKIAALTASAWQLVSATRAGKGVALSPDKATTMELFADGTSNMEGPGCFYRTGRWHQVSNGIELTDQVSVVMYCYAITDFRELAGGTVLTGLAGTLTAPVTPTTLTLRNGDITAVFSNAGPLASDPSLTRGPTTGAPTSTELPRSTR